MRALVLLLLLAGCPSTPSAGEPVSCWYDGDGDGYGTGEPVDSYAGCGEDQAGRPGDCDDSVDWINPGAVDELADSFDADCDGVDPWPCFVDEDSDGFGLDSDPMGYDACEERADRSPFDGDCDDGDPDAYPFAAEVVGDGVDQDCDGADLVRCYWDDDQDGFGVGEPSVVSATECLGPNQATTDGDCHDLSGEDPFGGTVYPGAPAACDGNVSDCDLWPGFAGEPLFANGCARVAWDTNDALLLPALPLGESFTVEGGLVFDRPESTTTVLALAETAPGFVLSQDRFGHLIARVGDVEHRTEAPLDRPGLTEDPFTDFGAHVALLVDGTSIRVLSGAEELLSFFATVDWSAGFVLGATLSEGQPLGQPGEHRFAFVRVWDRARGELELATTLCRPLLPQERDDLLFDLQGDTELRDALGNDPTWLGDPELIDCEGSRQPLGQ